MKRPSRVDCSPDVAALGLPLPAAPPTAKEAPGAPPAAPKEKKAPVQAAPHKKAGTLLEFFVKGETDVKKESRETPQKRKAEASPGGAASSPMKAAAPKGTSLKKANPKNKDEAKDEEVGQASTPALPPDLAHGLVQSGAAASAGDAAKAGNLRRVAQMRFLRSRRPTEGKRTCRTEKMPASICDAIEKDPLKSGYYFDLWCASSESWGKVLVYEKSLKRETTNKSFKEVWVTKELLEQYSNSADIAAAIIAGKAEPEHKRKHPEAPDFYQYLCALDEAVLQSEKVIKEKGISVHGEVDKEAAKVIVPKVQEALGKVSATPTPSMLLPSVKSEEDIEREEEKRKQALERKRQKMEKEESNCKLGALSWLKGVGKLLERAHQAKSDANAVADDAVKQVYLCKFEGRIAALNNTRGEFELGLSGEAELTAEKVNVAKDVVKSFIQDHKAFNKVISVYAIGDTGDTENTHDL